MAAINPTDTTALIIDEFIQHATTHLTTVSGIINTLSLYPPSPTPAPGIINWTGYTVPPATYTNAELRDRIILNEIIAKPDDGSVQLETDPEINKQFNENKGDNEGYKVDPEAGGFTDSVTDLVASNIVVPAILPASLVYGDIGNTTATSPNVGTQGAVVSQAVSNEDEDEVDTSFGGVAAAARPPFRYVPPPPKVSSTTSYSDEGLGATVPLGKLSVVTGGRTITVGESIGLTREEFLKKLNFADGIAISGVDMSRDWATIATQYISKKEGFTESSSWDVNAYRLGYGTDKILLDNGTIRTVLPTKEYYERTKEKKPANGDKTSKEAAAKVLELQVRTTYKDKVVGTSATEITEEDWNALNDRQRAACVSFVYNCGSFGNHPHIIAAIKAKNYIAAANGILNGPIAGGDAVYSGLIRRRAEEAGIFAYGL